jgi:putative two-component system response regulator
MSLHYFRPARVLQVEGAAVNSALIQHELDSLNERMVARRVDSRADYGRALRDFTPDLVIADYPLRDFDCRDAVTMAREASPNLPMIFVGAGLDEALQGVVRTGATDFVARDQLIGLGAIVRRALTGVRETRARVLTEAAVRNERLQADRRRLEQQEVLRQNFEDSIRSLALAVELRDPYTAGHQARVAHLAGAIARSLDLDADRVRGIELGATVHDVGKLAVPAEILAKPGCLTLAEMETVRHHARAGYEILKHTNFVWPVAEMVWQHHERLDGSGYPRGLKGDQIMLESRIIAVADVVDAMAGARPYRAALGIDAALAEIARGRNARYDAAVVEACLGLFRERGYQLPEDPARLAELAA